MGFCEFEDKAKFVSNKLLPLVTAAEKNIRSLTFEYRDGCETVIAVYKGGKTQEIDVTGDSLTSLTLDVLNALEVDD